MVEQIPVLKLGPILMVSIQTQLHDRAAEELQISMLKRLEDTGAEAILLDITALEFVDSFISRIICETVQMTRLMNAKTVLVGMQPAVVATADGFFQKCTGSKLPNSGVRQ